MKHFGHKGLSCWIALSLNLAAYAASAATCETSSGPTRVAILELYTSEGCNSCPRAERWLRQTMPAKYGLRQIVPLAFHVDYWDYLGWKDRFAQSRFSARQQLHARRNRAQTIYTPQFLLNGKDLRVADSVLSQRLALINAQTPGAQIHLRQTGAVDHIGIDVTLSLLPGGKSAQTEAFVALSEIDLYSEVRAGENAGKRLAHEFVVRELLGPIALEPAASVSWSATIPIAPDWKRENLALTVFVQDAGNNDILQALRAPACDGS